ncbi:hypothetical protein H0H93_001745 [Arthromyces matolae]|nr:hypothetical protein H0H93_001745 [Arthromyces matolae]
MVEFQTLRRSSARDLGLQRSEVNRQIQELKSFSSSSRLLPPEILAYIFEFAITYQDSRAASIQFARQLSLVCSSWRTTMLSHHDLWNIEEKKLVKPSMCLSPVPDGQFFFFFHDNSYVRDEIIRSVVPFFCRITNLHLDVRRLDLFNFLAFPGASELPLQVAYLTLNELRSVRPSEWGSDQQTSSISCPHLTKSFMAVTRPAYGSPLDFSYLHLPALNRFNLFGTLTHTLCFSDFRSLLERNGASIRTMHLLNVHISNVSLSKQTFETLLNLPSLECLFLHKIPYKPQNLMQLTTHVHPRHPLPNLQTLSVSVDSYRSRVQKKAVDEMEVLISAWMADPARRTALKNISFDIFCPLNLGSAFKGVSLTMEKLKTRVLDLYRATDESPSLEVRMRAFIYTTDDHSGNYSSTYHDEDEEGAEG